MFPEEAECFRAIRGDSLGWRFCCMSLGSIEEALGSRRIAAVAAH